MLIYFIDTPTSSTVTDENIVIGVIGAALLLLAIATVVLCSVVFGIKRSQRKKESSEQVSCNTTKLHKAVIIEDNSSYDLMEMTDSTGDSEVPMTFNQSYGALITPNSKASGDEYSHNDHIATNIYGDINIINTTDDQDEHTNLPLIA